MDISFSTIVLTVFFACGCDCVCAGEIKCYTNFLVSVHVCTTKQLTFYYLNNFPVVFRSKKLYDRYTLKGPKLMLIWQLISFRYWQFLIRLVAKVEKQHLRP